MSTSVTVLFARSDSVYKTLPRCDVYDAERNALNWPGGTPVVAHPPCRLWANLRSISTAPESEKHLARWAVTMVRRFGGVLEHPAGSQLWASMGMPPPGSTDQHGGFTVAVSQWWWGHRAEKKTWLYVVGCTLDDLPLVTHSVTGPACIIGTPGRRKDGSRLVRGDLGWRPEVSKREREATPLAFAEWLVSVGRICAGRAHL